MATDEAMANFWEEPRHFQDFFPHRPVNGYHLPPYSPELNAIERFWKKLKYQLLPVGAWESFTTLLGHATTALCALGETTYLPSLEGYAE